MNEQLVVKNFGPIKDATVDFKRVTVFIGPTGGGKSTLAKLAAVFRNEVVLNKPIHSQSLRQYSLKNYWTAISNAKWKSYGNFSQTNLNKGLLLDDEALKNYIDKAKEGFTIWIDDSAPLPEDEMEKVFNHDSTSNALLTLMRSISKADSDKILMNIRDTLTSELRRSLNSPSIFYFPTERVFLSAIEYSWPGLMRDDIGLPKSLLAFANRFSLSRKPVSELDINFLNVKYIHTDGRDFIKIPEREEPLMLLETASGIQSVTPLLVLLEHLSRNTEQAQSFIIEEPELNLFPTAQFELVKILVDKCARLEGQNDLVLTTHSPYVLTALNLLCYAFRIAQQDEATARKVAKLVPRHCWIDPEQFAAYYVDLPGTKRKQQVRSIINKKTGLIEENELDTASDELSGIFDKLVRLHKPATTSTRTK